MSCVILLLLLRPFPVKWSQITKFYLSTSSINDRSVGLSKALGNLQSLVLHNDTVLSMSPNGYEIRGSIPGLGVFPYKVCLCGVFSTLQKHACEVEVLMTAAVLRRRFIWWSKPPNPTWMPSREAIGAVIWQDTLPRGHWADLSELGSLNSLWVWMGVYLFVFQCGPVINQQINWQLVQGLTLPLHHRQCWYQLEQGSISGWVDGLFQDWGSVFHMVVQEWFQIKIFISTQHQRHRNSAKLESNWLSNLWLLFVLNCVFSAKCKQSHTQTRARTHTHDMSRSAENCTFR